MITKQELQQYAKNMQLNLGQTELNYLHIITLHAISRLFPDTLVFKGGTALMICQNLDRFSEDLDFTATTKNDAEKIITHIQKFLQEQDIETEVEHVETTPISKSFYLRFKGPTYNGTRQTTRKIEIDISFREDVKQETEPTRILHPYKDTPTFYIQCMSLEEILAEKIRAILTRQKARDVYDTEYLIARKIKLNIPLINTKLHYYDKTFTKKELAEKLEEKRKLWTSELKNLVTHTEEFETVKKRILDAI
jgi:predicted nucleotidyltransferase component of viral defense system